MPCRINKKLLSIYGILFLPRERKDDQERGGLDFYEKARYLDAGARHDHQRGVPNTCKSSGKWQSETSVDESHGERRTGE